MLPACMSLIPEFPRKCRLMYWVELAIKRPCSNTVLERRSGQEAAEMNILVFTIALGFLSCFPSTSAESTYLVGVGRYDITGPAAEVNMMGYASLEQTTKGIHFRQWSRAFIFADSQGQSRVVFVSVDTQTATQIMKMEVIRKLGLLYGGLYTEKNVLISGTHTHSGPAGYFQYILYQVTSLGFVKETFEPLVDGIVASVRIAHESMQAGRLYINSGELLDASINRSPTSYLQNPPEERARYSHDTDKDMTVVKVVSTTGEDLGMIDWFAVHTVSMGNTNRLISGDNKGVASLLMELDMAPQELPGKGAFVAAFAQSNEGDVSPNINGARCLDTGEECDAVTSTCNGKPEKCVGSGPGSDMFESTKIIGKRQFTAGKVLYQSASTPISGGSVDFRHTYIDMSSVNVQLDSGEQVQTCTGAMGFSFAAGTTDGTSDVDFTTQGDTSGDPFLELVRDFLSEPPEEQIQCHAPKPILLYTGGMHFPYEWQPNIVDLQLLRIGQLVIVGVPGEFTTMSGRRLRENVKEALVSNGFPNDTVVVIAGLSNVYTHYVTTFEEYQQQRYEAGSTIFGPHTLSAYIQEFKKLAVKMALGETVQPGPSPPNLLSKQISLLPPVVFDGNPLFVDFGDVYSNAKGNYVVGSTVEVVFWSGHPRNNLMIEGTFLTVERRVNSEWVVVHNDASLDTRFEWNRISVVLGWSRVTVQWDIALDTPPGRYRIRHYGHYKQAITGNIKPYSGRSRSFQVT